MKLIQSRPVLLSAFSLAALAPVLHAADEVEEVVVTAEFRETATENLAASVSLIGAQQLQDRGAEHLEEVLNMAPNVNFSSGASRGRFLQIRGIGERAEFIEPVNHSVGVIVDGIDLTGISTAATMLDVQQVEVLRGPQGTLYGANALAGLVNVVSNQPADETEGKLEATVGDYNTRVLKGVVSGPVSERSGYRIAAQSTKSDGFMENAYLNREDTANIDENSVRGKFNWAAGDDWTFDLTAFYADVDNGYDAFTLDNTRTTLSDEPGHDRQQTTAASLKTTWVANDTFDVVALLSTASSDIEYGYDEDWANPDICAGTDCEGWEYSSFDNYERVNSNNTLDLRIVSQRPDDKANWIAGIYSRDQQVDLTRIYTYNEEDFTSNYETSNTAVYAEVNVPLSDQLTYISGLRLERRTSDYSDSNGQNFDPEEDLWGGKVSAQYQRSDGKLVYGLVSRGYKAGGFNTNDAIPAAFREYDTESMLNYEIGYKGKWLEDRLKAQVSLFYQDREDIQTDQSLVVPKEGDTCPCDFEDYLDNAASGKNYGLEAQFDFLVNEKVSLFGTLGLLETEFDDYISFSHTDADEDTGTGVDMNGREQAHAPNWQYTLGADFSLGNNLTLRADIEGKDSFYFSDGHDEKSDSYQLVNARLSWENDPWLVALWGKNLTDEDYQVRGFGSFGNDPRKFYVTEPYYQFGAPRTLGLTASYRF